jgi:hypothetical protein
MAIGKLKNAEFYNDRMILHKKLDKGSQEYFDFYLSLFFNRLKNQI